MRRELVAALAWAAAAGPWGQAAFVGAYVVVCVACLPTSALTFGAGAAFGVARGFVLVLLGSTLGACAAFLISRWLLRDFLLRRLAAYPAFAAVAEAVGAEGWRVVLLTRLSHAVPFLMLNYAYGATTVSFSEYALATCLGMLPSTLLSVWLGAAAGAALRSGARARTTLEWALFAAGAAGTAVAAWLVARKARGILAVRRAGVGSSGRSAWP